MELLDWINDQLTVLAEAFGEPLTEERQEIYCASLTDIQHDRLNVAFRRALRELTWFPKIAELREFAGTLSQSWNDGRAGPEEAWARMPKGERMEQDSVVWCEEERIAYGACRSLLMDGDPIGARMAFKERYEREVAQARSESRPVRWSVSAGYDVEHRLLALASAVHEKRVALESALDFIPSERRVDFAQMLPPAQSKGLLAGTVKSMPDLPGLPGILTKMRMEGTIPEELKPEARNSSTTTALTDEELRKRRNELKAQVDFLKRSRNGPRTGTT